jgi:FkbM family methyltransferase
MRSLRPGMVVVDGGAHIGLYTLLAAERIGSTGHVLAFEPDPYNYRALLRNIANHGASNVSARQMALADVPGSAEFFHSSGTISGSLIERGDVGPMTPSPVPTTTIDREVDPYAGNDLLVKLDIEGAEPLALEGMNETMRAGGSISLVVELNQTALESGSHRPGDLVEKLRGGGFEVSFVDEENARCVPADSSVSFKGNLYCTRPSP